MTERITMVYMIDGVGTCMLYAHVDEFFWINPRLEYRSTGKIYFKGIRLIFLMKKHKKKNDYASEYANSWMNVPFLIAIATASFFRLVIIARFSFIYLFITVRTTRRSLRIELFCMRNSYSYLYG